MTQLPAGHESEMDDHTEAVPARHVMVLGATGYVGGRLVPELLRNGHRVRVMTRDATTLDGVEWSEQVEVTEGDLLDPTTLTEPMRGVDTIVYLVHSLGEGEDFRELERRCATNTAAAARDAGVRRIVYLSGLGDERDALSEHLASRHEVGVLLASGPTTVVELRAAVVLGAGSASFEMLRSLVEVLPVMIAPAWVHRTLVQPIAIADVLAYLAAAVNAEGDDGTKHHRIVQIGGRDVLTYRKLMDVYAAAAGLRRRIVVPVPWVSPMLSAHWVNVVTPLPRGLSRSLISSLTNDVVVTDESAKELSALSPMGAGAAIEAAISAIADQDMPTRWAGVTPRQRSARPAPWDPDWAGGRC
ncbi:MAG: NAD(P)H-binding protein [Ilumatobacteraceae bacterium]